MVYAWDRQPGTQHSLNMVNTGFSHPSTIGLIRLGSSIRSDGKSGINVNWSEASPNNDLRLPKDFFAMRS